MRPMNLLASGFLLQTVPSGGGYDAMVTATVLAIERRLSHTLKNYSDVLFSSQATSGEPINTRMEETDMEAAYKV